MRSVALHKKNKYSNNAYFIATVSVKLFAPLRIDFIVGLKLEI